MRKLLACLLLVGLTACTVFGDTNSDEATVVPTATPNIPATIQAAEQAAVRNAVAAQIAATIRAPTPVPWSTATPLPIAQPSVAEMVETVRAAVVRIETLSSGGSGTIITPDGYVLTNYHVVEGNTVVDILIQDRYYVTGSVIGYDENLDLAVVKINGGPWSFLPVTSSRPAVGEEIFILGYALAYDLEGESSLTSGRVSALRADGHLTWIQTDAAINGGNSGGAALNSAGQLIGVPTWGYEGADVNNVEFLVALFSVADEIPLLMAGKKFSLPKTLPPATPIATPTPAPTSLALQTYINPDAIWRVDYPKQWSVERSEPDDSEVVSFISPAGTAAFSVTHFTGSGGQSVDLSSWSNSLVRTAESTSSLFRLRTQESIKLGDHPAYLFVYDASDSDWEWTHVGLHLVAGNDAYIVTGKAFTEEWDEIGGLLTELVYSFSPMMVRASPPLSCTSLHPNELVVEQVSKRFGTFGIGLDVIGRIDNTCNKLVTSEVTGIAYDPDGNILAARTLKGFELDSLRPGETIVTVHLFGEYDESVEVEMKVEFIRYLP